MNPNLSELAETALRIHSSGDLHLATPTEGAQTPDNHAKNTRSTTVNFGRFLAERLSTPI
jgi:hypothetical protein